MTTMTDSRTEALEQVGASFKHATAATRRLRGRETHRPGELSFAQYSLLFSLANGSAMSSRELAVAADLTAATVTQMLDSLEAAGLVQRTRSPTDKRVVLTALSDRGRAVVEERRARYEPLWREALDDFSESELRSAAAVLDRLGVLFDRIAES
jgi:MarR family transcriptional regulator, organic hydroperoxide resistance regulator